MTKKVWFITGASSGLGYAFTRSALEKGEYVVASARRMEAYGDLLEKGQD